MEAIALLVTLEARTGKEADAAFEDPDGNAWIVQEVTRRAPGRELSK